MFETKVVKPLPAWYPSLHNVNLSKNIYSKNGKIWKDETGRDGRLGLALSVTCVTTLQYRVKRRKRTESCLFQEVSTVDLEARLDVQLGLNEPPIPRAFIREVEV